MPPSHVSAADSTPPTEPDQIIERALEGPREMLGMDMAYVAVSRTARIVFVCDAYHAMTSDRPYREALAVEAALCELESNAGSQFCPITVAAATRLLRPAIDREPPPPRAPSEARQLAGSAAAS